MKEPAKNFAIIGLGGFGQRILNSLVKRRLDVVVIDNDEEKIQRVRDIATMAVKADALHFDTLKEVLPDKLHCVIVDMGRHQLERSILVTNYVHKLEVPQIIVHAISPAHAEILHIVGATRVIFPEAEAAERLTGILAGRGAIDFFAVSENFSVVEVPALKSWTGRTLKELDVRKQHRINIVAWRTSGEEEKWQFADPGHRFKPTDIVLMAGETTALERLTE